MALFFMKSCEARWNPNKFGWNQSLAASMKLNPSIYPPQAISFAKQISSTTGGFISSWDGFSWKKTILSNSLFSGDPYGNRTHDCALRGRRLNRLTKGPYIHNRVIISHFFVNIKSFFAFYLFFYDVVWGGCVVICTNYAES